MKKVKQIVSVVLCLLMLVAVVPVMEVFANTKTNLVGSGFCGANLIWTLSNDGLLTISGEGAMQNYSSPGNNILVSPFYQYRTLIEQVVINSSVTTIGEWAFCDCSKLKSVIIPDNIKSIHAYAFSGCESLSSIDFGNGLTSIGSYAFVDCSNLDMVTVGFNVTTIAEGAFLSCENLSKVYISDLEAWCKISFGNYYSNPLCYAQNLYLNNVLVTNLVIPNNTISIQQYAFTGCTSIVSVIIPNSVVYIHNRAFYKCINLAEIHINDIEIWCNISFENAYANPLYYAHNLYINNTLTTHLEIPNNMTEINSYTFYNCTGFSSVTIPNSVKKINRYAFNDCTSISDVFYYGSKADWERINIDSVGNSCLTKANIIFRDGSHEHVFIPEVTTAATCSATGIRTFTCSCGDSYTETIPVNASNHVNTTNKDAVASTCTVKGYTAGVYCNDCKQYISGHAEQPLAAHQTATQNAKTATCTAAGYTGDQVCTVCKQTITKGTAIAKKSHTLTTVNKSNPGCTTAGYTGDQVCTTCNQTITKGSAINALGHANADSNGNCTRCGTHIKDVTPSQPSNPQPNPNACKYCGQVHSGPFGWLIKFFHSILAIFKR